MKLFYSPMSPYVRKVMAVAIEAGVEDRIEKLATSPYELPPDLVKANPLSKIPALITDDGEALFDSPVICEYLDSLAKGPRLYPPAGPARWRALTLHSLGQGLLDAAVLRRQEGQRGKDKDRDAHMAKLAGQMTRSLDALEARTKALEGPATIGSLTVGCALGYLDFRYAAEDWRKGRPRLAAWYDAFARRPSLVRTAPKEAA
ncbi:MAG: glutathione S-transferase N-terminal domain-containing protein [Proteobacteria bacterium]|nr:glutathione S-transferase N-terminal domain-containing protein [Pseudomonadota bacterium]